ncbi:restriction endonuclease subunit S [Micromonospora sp. NPDC048986]|uniref:restriction endonuclease subunit S n=1 Tax=Micromonospora sp. NPDC048986 TaxID=3155644 RepID=UPI0033E02E7E
MSEWRNVAIGQLGEIVTGGTPRAAEYDSWGDDIDFLTPTDQREDSRDAKPARRLSKVGAARLSQRLLPPGAICFTCIGSTIGKVSLVSRPTVTNQQINSILPDPEVADSRFVYYLLKSCADEIVQIASGSATPIINKTQFGRFIVRVPERSTQSAIGQVLGALDDKIAVNERIAATAFELMQSMWQSTAAGSIEMAPFSDLATIEKGLSYKGQWLGDGAPLVNLANFGVDGRFKASQLKYYSGEARDQHWVRSGDLVLANTDLTQRREILGQPALVAAGSDRALFSHHVFAVRPAANDDRELLWLYGALRSTAFRERAVTFATGTTVASLPRDAVLTHEVPMPPAENRLAWAATARTLIDASNSRVEENGVLSRLRDTLLPRLASGELRVKDVERQVSDAV